MKLFGRTAGYYLFWTGFVYFWVCVYLAFTQTGYSEYASLGFVLALSVPLLCPPVARHFNMEPVMFDWIKNLGKPSKETYPTWSDIPDLNRIGDDMKKVIPPIPEVRPPAPEKDPVTFYYIGPTDNGRVSFKMGGSSITMNAEGIKQLINHLTVAMENIPTDVDDEAEE